MPIWLKNFQSKVFFNENLLKMHCCFLLNAFGTGKYDISVVCVSTRRIQHLNKTYRRDDTPTDVLSFPYHEVDIIHTSNSSLSIYICTLYLVLKAKVSAQCFWYHLEH